MKQLLIATLLILSASSLHAGIAEGEKGAAATPHPASTAAAMDVLREGGNAIDAAAAASFTLAVADPSSASPGGGGLLLWFDSAAGAVWALDFREIAPRELSDAETAGAMIAVPGFVPGLAAAHERFGALSWSEVLAPALALAREGARLTPHVAALISAHGDSGNYPVPLRGTSASSGVRLNTDELADTLELVSKHGPDAFSGSRGRKLVSELRESGSTVSLLDMESYEPVWRAPLRIDLGARLIYTMPPPSGGGIALARLLKAEAPPTEAENAEALDAWLEHSRAASLERIVRAGDPERTRLALGEEASIEQRSAAGQETDGGAALAVVDAAGNAVAIVLTNGSKFGSGVRAGGFLFNDSQRDFSPAGQRGPNGRESRRRPATSSSPVLIIEDGSVRLAAAASGGSVASSALGQFVAALLSGETPQDAIAAPRYHHEGSPERIVIERRGNWSPLADQLSTGGRAVRVITAAGEIHAVFTAGGRLAAVSDPRGGGAPGAY